jgi:hypothetical protein
MKIHIFTTIFLLIAFNLLFSSEVRSEEKDFSNKHSSFAEAIAYSALKDFWKDYFKSIIDFFIPRFYPIRLLGLNRGYFLLGWKQGKSITVGYSFAIGREGSFPLLFSLSLNSTSERFSFEFAAWSFLLAFQLSGKYNFVQSEDGRGIVLGFGPIFSFSGFPIAYEFSLDFLHPTGSKILYGGIRFMNPLIKIESGNLPYVPIYNFRIIFGMPLNRFIFEGQFGLGKSGIFLLFGFALNIRSSDYIIKE